MSDRSRGPAWLIATTGVVFLVAACSDAPTTARDEASALAPAARPSMGYGLPFPCTSASTCVGEPVALGDVRVERVTVCKRYPTHAVNPPAVKIVLDAKVTAASRTNHPNAPLHLEFMLLPNTCLRVWGNGEQRGPDADTVTVTEIAPAGYTTSSQLTTLTSFNPPADDTTKFAPSTATTVTSIVGGPGKPGFNVTFTNTPILGEVGDLVFEDVDGDGAYDAGEPGVPGVTLTLDGGPTTTTTNASGAYGFAGLPLGAHTVTITVPSGYVLSGGSATRSATLTEAAPNDLTVDYALVRLGAIGDRVWSDTDGDGVQDAGEPGIVGATVTLTKGSTAVASTTTGANGAYAFPSLAPGSYVVAVTGGVPAGMTPTHDRDGVSSPNTATVVVASGQTVSDADFGYAPARYVVGDRVWNDVNGNGVQDGGEPGLAGVTVTATDAANNVVASATTAPDGSYTIGNLLPGQYRICTTAGVPAGATATYDLDGAGTPNCATVTVAGSRSDVDFGYVLPGSVGDFVWNDLDKDGIQDVGEPGLAGVTVTLTKGSTTRTATTSASGAYTFANVTPGTWTITVSNLPLGWVASPSNVGANDAVDSDGSGSAVVVTGAPNTTVDFGFHMAAGTASCTYTQGYWKNHESAWPRPYSATAQWMTPAAKVVGMTWDGLFGTPPKGGNSYVSLAHQWMAAKLNQANGAPMSTSVLTALNSAEAWLLAQTPVNGALPSIKSAQADAWASTLDRYNNGLSGPPHCN